MTPCETGLAEYQEAKDFWRWFHTDPDADMMLGVHDGRDVIVQQLVGTYGEHPRIAAMIARLANDSVQESMGLRRGE